MREKQFDHIENKIREAAENVEPAFDEQGWQKMELLLDKENDRKRPLIWFLLPLLLCASIAGYFIFNNKTTSVKVPVTAQEKNTPVNLSLNDQPAGNGKSQGQDPTATQTQATKQVSSATQIPVVTNGPGNNSGSGISAPVAAKRISKTNSFNDPFYVAAENASSFYKKPVANKGKTKISITRSNASDDTDNGNEPLDATTAAPNENAKTASVNIDAAVKKDSSAVVKKDAAEKEKTKENTAAKKTDDTKKERKSSRFYFLATAGAEASSTKFLSFDNNAVVAKYNLGVGYQLTGRLGIQTGFNVSRKKYIAGAGDYNPKSGSYWSTVEIKKVDANCLVYEIPLAVRYDVLHKKSFNVFATGGLSSFIMKKEEYYYHYIRDNNYYEHNMSYTGNKNFFSVLTLSAGVEKKLNNGFSLLAEPSVSVPVAGVGDGRVKLYSVGLQLGLKYQPFKKKKK